jgi:outer membrane receptor protein involved in Fe transport
MNFKAIVLPILAVLLPLFCFAQSVLTIEVHDAKTLEPLVGVTVTIPALKIGASTDATGKVNLSTTETGTHEVKVSYLGYQTWQQTIVVPGTGDTIHIALKEEEEELEEVVVSSTRSSRTISDLPTRIETIAGEELDEKSNMNSGSVSMLLRESTGIQTQQTSAVSGNMNIRIQGLDGRYTQLLQNGFPIYAGFSSGLSIMQIPPLDLKQVEIIKGSSSTLYGGGAIAGLINFIQKDPQPERELLFMTNLTSAGGIDLNGYYGKRNERMGFTLFASGHKQRPYDPNNDQFTDIPEFRRLNLNPRLFLYLPDESRITFGVNTTFEERNGGFIPLIRNEANPESNYLERNQTTRISTQLQADKPLGEGQRLYLKNTVTAFDRAIELPNHRFAGVQWSSFSEIGYVRESEKTDWLFGLNAWTDRFNERPQSGQRTVRDYNLPVFGAFIQNTWDLSKAWSLESGLRGDYQPDYGAFALPRLALLWKINPSTSSRIGGGLGYKLPTIFLQESEEVAFQNVLPINTESIKAERSMGLNWDINYRGHIGEELSFSINQMFFYTRLNSPLVLNADSLTTGTLAYENAMGNIDTKGFETNLKFGLEPFKLFLMYSYIDGQRHYNQLENELPLTARHRVGTVLMYEVEDKWRVGLEGYYTGPQRLSSGEKTRDYWITGFMVERIWERFNLFLNFENFLDTRITRWQPVYSGSIQQPEFSRELYAPTEGRIINGGIKIKL